MASISHDKATGRRTIQFVAADGKRKSVRLGKASRKAAEAVKTKIEALAAASITGHAPSDETSRWVAGLDDMLRGRLAAVGLVDPAPASMTLEGFIDDYLAKRTDVKPRTQIIYRQAKKSLIEYFGPHKAIRSITEADADDWQRFMFDRGLAKNTVRKRSGIAKLFFKTAVRAKLIASNPFGDLASAVQSNPEGRYFVTREVADKVIDHCPDAEWRLIFGLARFGGLRVPSEVLALRWSDVDWAGGRMMVLSPKTAHHPGGESRVIPLFPELVPFLQDVFELADEGVEHVITRYRSTNANLRTQLHRIIRRAGLDPWPKPFHNCRSSRETELAERWPIHVVCEWIGNSEAVAAKHYLQVTDDHFREASEAVRNPVQSPAVSGCKGLHEDDPKPAGSAKNPEMNKLSMGRMHRVGLEPTTR